MRATVNSGEFRSFKGIPLLRAIATALAGLPEQRQARKDLALSSIRTIREFFTALTMAVPRAPRHPSGGCAMLRGKVCLGVLVAALACASTSFAQGCSSYRLWLFIEPTGTTISPSSASCPPGAILYLWGGTDAPVGADILYASGPAPVDGMTVGEHDVSAWSAGGAWALIFTVPGEYAFQVQGLDISGQSPVPMGSPEIFTVFATNGADPTNFGVCRQCQVQAGAPINLTNGNVWVQERDYSLPGLGGGLELVRTWNSLWQWSSPTMPGQAGMFGNSWRSTYEEMLTWPRLQQ